MERDDGEESVRAILCFRSRAYTLLIGYNLDEHDLNQAEQKVHESLETFLKQGR